MQIDHADAVADIAFLAIRTPHSRLLPMLSVASSILANAATIALRFHVVADQRAEPLRAAINLLHERHSKNNGASARQRAPLWLAHSTARAPAWAARLHRKLCARGCIGPVCDVYMHKLLLHVYLPRALRRVIFLDSDVLVRSDIALLWQQFGAFAPGQAIGIADEENPFAAQEPVTRLGGISSNGGVVLLDLAGLRAAGFTSTLWRYASRDPALPLNGDRGVGMAAEQVLYSWMSIEGAPGHALIGRIPCGWNVQVGSWPSHVARSELAAPKRRCTGGCHLLHGAGGEGKAALALLRAELEKGRSCAGAFEAVRAGRRHYPRGSASEALLLRVRDRCCANWTRTVGE